MFIGTESTYKITASYTAFSVIVQKPYLNYLHSLFALSGTQKEVDCVPCDAGYYCLEPGNSSLTAQCSAGYFCVGGAKTATPVGETNCLIYQ